MGGGVVAVSVDAPADSLAVVQRQKLPFPILSDARHEVIREYGLVHPKGGPGGSDVAIPASFLVDQQGQIVWRHVALRVQDRPDPQQILREVNHRWGGGEATSP